MVIDLVIDFGARSFGSGANTFLRSVTGFLPSFTGFYLEKRTFLWPLLSHWLPTLVFDFSDPTSSFCSFLSSPESTTARSSCSGANTVMELEWFLLHQSTEESSATWNQLWICRFSWPDRQWLGPLPVALARLLRSVTGFYLVFLDCTSTFVGHYVN